MISKSRRFLDLAVEAPQSMSEIDIANVLASSDNGLWREIFLAAKEVKRKCGKVEVLPRGLIECSNTCAKNCLYCGIRRDNRFVSRYMMSEDEVLECCDEARRRKYAAVAFQAGEIESEANTRFYEHLLEQCRDLEVTLSLGEQDESVYDRWRRAGAMRYLIRIETSNRELYSRIHPSECSFDRRVQCIRTLKRLGYITGTGVMIGLPGQTMIDLARDILFFGKEHVDMVGMGPYIPHENTPLGKGIGNCTDSSLQLSLRMIALTRLHLHDVNIVAATALETLDPFAGQRRGIEAGANVIMPNLTPDRYRCDYSLYPGKP